MFPIAVYGFISNEAKALGIVSMVFLSIGGIITNTDGTLLTFVVEWTVMLFLLKKDKEKAGELFIGAIIYRLRTRFSSGDLFLQLRAVAFIGAMVSSAFLVVQGITLGFFGVIL